MNIWVYRSAESTHNVALALRVHDTLVNLATSDVAIEALFSVANIAHAFELIALAILSTAIVVKFLRWIYGLFERDKK